MHDGLDVPAVASLNRAAVPKPPLSPTSRLHAAAQAIESLDRMNHMMMMMMMTMPASRPSSTTTTTTATSLSSSFVLRNQSQDAVLSSKATMTLSMISQKNLPSRGSPTFKVPLRYTHTHMWILTLVRWYRYIDIYRYRYR
jgi:hypothetical protein